MLYAPEFHIGIVFSNRVRVKAAVPAVSAVVGLVVIPSREALIIQTALCICICHRIYRRR
jgi:hypothetical protein